MSASAGSGTSDCNVCEYVSMPSGVLPGSGVDIGFAGFGEAVIQKMPSWNQSNACGSPVSAVGTRMKLA